tara:strand:- start:692 stop:928 length:237 start_codon:yes stop_codon:yes gene_type:complete
MSTLEDGHVPVNPEELVRQITEGEYNEEMKTKVELLLFENFPSNVQFEQLIPVLISVAGQMLRTQIEVHAEVAARVTH